jgi:hypothetical protein
MADSIPFRRRTPQQCIEPWRRGHAPQGGNRLVPHLGGFLELTLYFELVPIERASCATAVATLVGEVDIIDDALIVPNECPDL